MDIGGKIAYARKMKGLTQTELAKRAGVSKAAISAIELGKNTPAPPTVAKLSEILEVPVEKLVTQLVDRAVAQEIANMAKEKGPELVLMKLRRLGVDEQKITRALELLL